jgi:hypothetical protein
LGEPGAALLEAAVGSWDDLQFDVTLDALDRIRHESLPPPIDLDL